MADFHSKMSACRHELGVNPRQFQPWPDPRSRSRLRRSEMCENGQYACNQIKTL